MQFELTQEMMQSLTVIKERLDRRREDFLKELSSKGLDVEVLQSTKNNLYSICSSSNLNKYFDIMSDLVFFCEAGIISSNPSCYDASRRILFSEFKSVMMGGIVTLHNDTDTSDLDSTMQYSIYTLISEEMTWEDYSQEQCINDINYLVELFTNSDAKSLYNEAVLNDIKESLSSQTPLKCVKGTMENLPYIMECLQELYANTFSLYPYIGVITFFGQKQFVRKRKNGQEDVRLRNEDVRVRVDSNAQVFKPDLAYQDSTIYAELASNIIRLCSQDGLTKGNGVDYSRDSSFTRSERCFNLEDILNSENGLYYPYEAFGFATGSLFSDYYEPAECDIVYKNSGFVSWKEYSDYLKPKIEDLLIKFIYLSLEKHCRFQGKPFKFTDSNFIEDYEELGAIRTYMDYCDANSYQSLVLKDVDKFVKTICRAVIITRNDCNELYKVKLISFNTGAFSKSSTRDIFNSTAFIQGSKTAEFENGYSCPLKHINATVYEYTFCLDIQLMDKKPLFGYTAARLFQRSGQQISLKNILIGETEDGSPLFSTEGGLVDMTSKVCHRFSSGSRSGKGVMTMNILASSIASDVALFYIDRKPDMTAELAYISDGRMFCVNGGDLQSTDVHQMFFDSKTNSYKSMLSKYHPGSSKYKYKYMTSVFGSDFGDTWKGAFGDLIYARAMILALSIVSARMYFTGNPCPEAESDLYIGGNVAVVVDEITNWHYQFEKKYFDTVASGDGIKTSVLNRFYNPLIGGSSVEGSALDEMISKVNDVEQELLLKYKQDIDKYREASNNGDEKATKALKSTISSLNTLLAKLQKKAGKESKDIEETLYWTTYMEKYKSIIDIVAAIKNAGIKQAMLETNDVYLIGQFISGYANAGDPINFNKDGTVRQQGMPDAQIKLSSSITPNSSPIPTETVTRSYLLGFAETLGCDWFTGRNLTDKNNPESTRHANFGGTHMAEVDPKLDSWLHTRGNWIYIPQGTQEQFRGGNIENIPQGAVKFKPYLVLNTNSEPSEGVALNDSGEVDKSKTVDSPYNKASLKYYDNGESGYVLNCAARVGFKDWEVLRLQHVPSSYGASPTNPCYGHLEEGIGLKGLIAEYKRTNPAYSSYEFDSSCLSKSEEIANNVVRRFGYSCYMEYLLDLSPKGLIGCQDIINIYTNPELVANEDARLRKQLPRYFNSGNGSLVDGSNASDHAMMSTMGEEIMEDIEVDDSYTTSSGDESSHDKDTTSTDTETPVTKDEPDINTTMDSFGGFGNASDWDDFEDDSEDDCDTSDELSDEELYEFCVDIMTKVKASLTKPISDARFKFYTNYLVSIFRKMGY